MLRIMRRNGRLTGRLMTAETRERTKKMRTRVMRMRMKKIAKEVRSSLVKLISISSICSPRN